MEIYINIYLYINILAVYILAEIYISGLQTRLIYIFLLAIVNLSEKFSVAYMMA